MSFQLIPPAENGSSYAILEITDPAGVNIRDKSISRMPDEANTMQNFLIVGRGMEKRSGSAVHGSAQSGDKVVGLGFLEQDSGITPLMMVNQTLYKYTGGAWAASDKTNYTANLDTSIVTFLTKSGSSLDNGTTTSGSTNYFLEDTGKAWTPGTYRGKCVVIAGEVKLITDNDATRLFLGDKLNSDTNSDYQTKTYNIYAVAPHAIVGNGTDSPQKYNLTTTTPLDGTHVTAGKALPLFKFLSVHQGRLVGSIGSGDSNDRLWLSDVSIAENFTTDTNLNVNLNFYDDGDQINAHGSLALEAGSVLLTAKSHSTHAIEGATILDYWARPVDSDRGCIAPKTFAISGKISFQLSHEGVIGFSVDEADEIIGDRIPISRSIQPDIDAMTSAQKTNACGVIFNNRYYLQVGTKAWYYDIEASLRQKRHVWVDLDFPIDFNILRVIDNTLYGGNSANGQNYTLLTGTQDSSTNVVAIYESGDITFPGMPNLWVERIEVTGEQSASTILRMQTKTDGGSYGAVDSQAMDNANFVYSFNVGKHCKSFRFKLTEAGSQSPVRIHFPIRVLLGGSSFGSSTTKQGS